MFISFFKKINAECRETKGEREREKLCVSVCFSRWNKFEEI